MPRFSFYLLHLQRCGLLWLCTVAVFFVARMLMLTHFVPENIRTDYSNDIPALLLKGFLFDIKAASLMSALFFLTGLLGLFRPRADGRSPLATTWAVLLFTLATLLATANWFYFSVYQRQFDVFMFGLFDEDTTAVLKTMWADYPVASGLIGLAAAALLFRLLLNKLPRRPHRERASAAVWVLLVLVPVLALAAGIRTSFGKFPLRQSDAQISSSPHLNKLVPNALVSLDWAAKEYRNSSKFEAVSDEDGSRLMGNLLGKAASADLNQLFRHTPAHPAVEQKQPNVVFAVMESMSSHLLNLHSPERDLLGRLKTHWQNDWVYPRFVSEGDGTSDSLHRLFIRSPRLDLSQSRAKNKQFPGNMFQPYLDAGYRVVYITAGNGGWRDFDNFLRHLGVHEVADENLLKKRYPEAKSSTWGVADEYMFRYAGEVLQQAEKSGQPVFIMLLSVTNHPPYRLPEGETKQNFTFSNNEQQRLNSLASSSELNEIFNTFRYSNDHLGHFISQVKQNAPETLIAATGDHNMRAIGYPQGHESALGHGVPFYLYVPPAYRTNARFYPERAGSHKDIMPTLYHLSLSNRQYYETGCNLTAPELDSPWCGYGYNTEVILTNNGFYRIADKSFYRWNNGSSAILEALPAPATPDAADTAQIQKASSYTDFLDWQINRIVSTQ